MIPANSASNASALTSQEPTRPDECSRCILDSSLPGISLNSSGECSNCVAFDELDRRYPLGDIATRRLEDLVALMKRAGQGKPYDCVVGVSGGTDSMFTLLTAHRLGLRPLAVHFDNGWNTHIAVRNIKRSLDALNVDLHTYVVDWQEFRDLQLSFLKASVPSVEVPTDLGIWSVLFRAARIHQISFILSGNCYRAEGVVPHAWGFKDARLVRSIQKRYGAKRLRTFPTLEPWMYAWYTMAHRIRFVRLLNYIDYSKEEAKATLEKEVGWTDYGGHHHESIYTRFFQSYLARKKFHMDRRLISLAALVRRGKLSRTEARARMQIDDYTDFLLEDDKKYVAKKLNISAADLNAIVASPPKSDLDFPSYYPLLRRIQRIVQFGRRFNLFTATFQTGRFGWD